MKCNKQKYQVYNTTYILCLLNLRKHLTIPNIKIITNNSKTKFRSAKKYRINNSSEAELCKLD